MIGHQNMGGVVVNSGGTVPYPQVPQGYYPQYGTIQQQSNLTQNARPMTGLQQVTQQVQQQPNIIPVPARMTSGLDDFRPNEVPSDGTVSLFMQNDYTAIYARALNAQGTIDVVKYVPERPAPQEQPKVTDFSSIDQRLERIEKLLKRKPRHHKPVNQEGDAQNE